MDGTGRLYAALRSDQPDYSIAKYDENGCLCWLRRYDGPGGGDDFARAVAVDAEGNVYVTGTSQGIDGNFDYATIKYGNEGDRLWVKRYDGTGKGNDLATVIAVESLGNVYVTGASRGCVSELDYATVKYDREGRQMWVKRYN